MPKQNVGYLYNIVCNNKLSIMRKEVVNPALKCNMYMRSLLLWDVWQRSLVTKYQYPLLIIAKSVDVISATVEA